MCIHSFIVAWPTTDRAAGGWRCPWRRRLAGWPALLCHGRAQAWWVAFETFLVLLCLQAVAWLGSAWVSLRGLVYPQAKV